MKQLTRRGFSKLLGIAALASTVTFEAACDWASVWTNIEKYVPVGLSAFASILSILAGGGVPIAPAISLAVSLVNTGFADLKAFVTGYQQAPAADKQTALGKISTALATLEANLQKFWSDLTIPDPKLEALVQGLLGVITTTLLGFGTQLPAPAPTPAIAARATLAKRTGGTPKKRSVAEFKKEFNGILAANGLKQHSI
jgi:hypothetical protein